MTLSNQLHAALLDHALGVAAYPQPTSVEVALSDADPGRDGSGINEPVGNGYARASTTGADWDAATEGTPATTENTSTVGFPQATGDWLAGADLAWFALYNGDDGEFMGRGALDTPKAVADGDTPQFGAGELVAQLGDPGDVYA